MQLDVRLLGLDDFDAVLLEVAEQVLCLRARELCLLDRAAQARGGHEAPLTTGRENALQLLHLDHGVRGDHCTL